MKKIAIFSMLIAGFMSVTGADAATAQRRGRASGASTTSTTTAAKPVSARAATGTRTAPRAAAPAASGGNTVVRGRAATTAATTAKPVAARAGVTQKVIGTGTKVSAAAKNVVVSEECQAKYDGCMDAFCMLDNETGGRCICSDKNAEYDSILAEIEKLDQQSYKMATVGVERLEMGADADAAMSMAQSVADSITAEEEKSTSRARRTLDLSMWDTTVDFDEDMDVFDAQAEAIDGKEGDALHAAASRICAAQIPECKTELNMLKMMYSQRVRSDCAAYENSLKQQKNASAQKLAAAEQALRQTALDQYRSANKYDLGQCTVQFKKCMQTTGGCGDDFSGCASVAAMDSTNTRKSTSRGSKPYQIKGAVTTIEISASTYDALVAKKPLCESVTKSCVNVASQVWDTFLREVAPQVKSAELIAEDKARQDCVGNISSCFQKACKDTMDPNDPDGSYDMCLSRPGTMLNVCKVPLNACGIDASSEAEAAKSTIWDFVVARLASMRVDSCTTEVKDCLQSEDRCGKDYSQCIGLDTDTIIRMCPYDKLVGCQKIYGETEIRGEAVYEELATMVQGIMLNIDNNMLTQCQNALNEAVIKVCGDSETCTGLTVDDNIGTRSLEYKICDMTASGDSIDINYANCRTDVNQIQDSELGRGGGAIKPMAGVIDGTIYWESVGITDDGMLDIESYWTTVSDEGVQTVQKDKINSELAVLQKNIETAIQTIESDPTIQFCMTGRQVQGMKIKSEDGETATRRDLSGGGRFPDLTKQTRTMIANAALKQAKDNYYAKYDELNNKVLQDYATIGARVAEINGENAKDARREFARQACVAFSEAASLPKSSEPPKNAFGKIVSMVALTAAAVAIPVAGAGVLAGTAAVAATETTAAVAGTLAGGLTTAGITTLAGAGAVAGIGLLGNAGSKSANGADAGLSDGALGKNQLVGSKAINQWNYKETITSTFEWETLVCHKCTRTQQCSNTKNPIFGNKYCKTWSDPVENCVDTQF